ncbi:MAG: two-component system sensor histidine kinase RpfC [Cocleimonas sp.]|jgi:two-component system sensor histidine kinase RpfC
MNTLVALTSWYSRLNKSLKKTGDTEPEQSKIRLAIAPLIIFYISSPWAGDESFSKTFITIGDLSITLASSMAISFSFCSIAIFVAIILNPAPSPLRRILGVAVDTTTLSVLMLYSGDGSVPLFFIYLWVILGNGFRYGVRYLYISQAFCIVSFLAVVLMSDYWQVHKSFGASLLLMLFILPLYASFLIKKLYSAIDIAKHASDAKSRFLANMSHELRTPLNGVIGMGELLRETELNYEQKELVSVMHSSANILLNLIENILDISKIEAGKVLLEEKKFDLHSLVNSVVYTLAPMSKTKDLSVTCNFDPETPFALKGDQQHVRQILINLVSNAIKFTKEGSVILSVKPASKRLQGKTVIRFEILDTGIGISEKMKDSIFDNFTQADASTSRSFGGTGLGTTISKELVELMGGNIGLTSEENKGSTFWFEIPFLNCNDIQHCISKYKVLLLAGEDCANIIRPSLKSWQINFDWIQTSSNALSLLLQANEKNEPFDTVLVDQDSLTNVNALELAQILKSKGLLETTSLVLVNASRTMIDANILNQYYVSTLDSPEEKRKVFNALHAAQRIKTDDVKVVPMAEYYDKHGGVRSLNILVAEDNNVNQKVIEGILKKAGHNSLLCNSGDKALDVLSESLETIDMVILDMNMPEVSGLDVVKALRFMDTSSKIPVIMLTADATPNAKEASLSAGANEFLTKPINAGRLLKTIASLSKTIATNNVSQFINVQPKPNGLSNSSFPESDWYDYIVFQELETLGKSPDFVISLLKIFEIEGSKHVHSIITAKYDNYFEYREKLHALKGSATELGANRLVQICVTGEALKPYEIGTKKVSDLAAELETIFASTISEFNRAALMVQNNQGKAVNTDN